MEESQDTFADLRAFFTIGFQDAPNGLWLGKHGMTREELPRRFYDACMAKNLSLVALTSEDDRMLPHSPEDRFEHLIAGSCSLLSEYAIDLLDSNLLRVERKADKKSLLVLNSETIHALSRNGYQTNWNGLKLHVLGANKLKKDYVRMTEAVKAYNDQGLLTFLTGITPENAPELLTELVAPLCYGIITHDANNTFYSWMRHIQPLRKYTTASNDEASHLASNFKRSGIAVSSAHFPHEIGNASILIPSTHLAPEKVRGSSQLLACIKRTLDDNAHVSVKGYNRMWNVYKFGRLLRTYGQDSHRFIGDEASSYNKPEEPPVDVKELDSTKELNRRPFF